MKSKKKLLVCLLAATMTVVPMVISAASNCPSPSICHYMCPAHNGTGGSLGGGTGGSLGGGTGSNTCPGWYICYGACPIH